MMYRGKGASSSLLVLSYSFSTCVLQAMQLSKANTVCCAICACLCGRFFFRSRSGKRRKMQNNLNGWLGLYELLQS